MHKARRINKRYTDEFKAEAVSLYLEDGWSPYRIAAQLGVRSKTQVQDWIKKHHQREQGELKEYQRGKTAWRKGRPKTKFSSIEEELAYIKAENDYLKKRYPNLHGE
ncbi:transposase [Brevibacillus brevis]|uniref:transposase n=1 Tax=Brevibacillus brevis TaxID=1393 RepID=UPI0027981467|nr:transposase [Brevibacillus brevis]